MKITVDQLAAIVNGKVEGDGSRLLDKFSPIEEAEEGSLTFLSNPKYASHLYTTRASAVLVDKDFVPEQEVTPALIRVDQVYATMSSLLDKFGSVMKQKTGIEQPSYIASDVKLGNDVYVGAFAYIGEGTVLGDNVKIYPQVWIGDNVKIADNTTVYPGAKIYPGTEIGSRCILHSGCVVGREGFGFVPQEDGSYKKIPQTGKVIIHDDVEIGANTCVDRATIKATVLEKGVKLDNLIQIAHNVIVGPNTAMAAQVGIAGSTKIGKNCVLAGQVGIVGHVEIAEGTQLGPQAGIIRSLKQKNGKYWGSPSDDYANAVKSFVVIRKLPELNNRIIELEKEIAKLKTNAQRDEH